MDVMSMKSSRRKQSKPIRVSYNEDSDMPLPPPQTEEEFVNGDNLSTSSDPEQEKENEIHMSNMTACNKCPESFPSFEQLSDHMRAVHSESRESSSPMNLAREGNAFPTAYHRLGSEFMKNPFVANGHDNRAMEGENNVDKNGNDVVDGEFGEKSDGEKMRDRSGIFHPDAYCDLCDKEFCNKYFLKTHKANKHGIYDNSTSPFAPSVNQLPPSLVLPQDYSSLPYKLNMDYPLPPLKLNSSNSNPTAKPPTPQLTPSNLPAMSPQRQSPPASQPLSQTISKPPQSPLLPSKPKSLDSLSTSTTSSEGGMEKKAVSQDMEDFCEICQKHFCNKYYLKKHKNDVHGIAPPDTPMSSGKRGGRPPNSELKLPATPVTSDTPLIPHSLANLPGLPNMPGVMVLNPFLPPMLIPAGSLMNQHGPLPPRPPHLPMSSPLPFSSNSIMSVTTASDNKSLSPGSLSTSATSSSPTSSLTSESLRNLGIPVPEGVSPSEALRRMGLLSPDGQIASEALRGMGILNNDAFCDICRKEFCNKYFLKIHKANKHGIYMDEPLLPPSMASAMNLPTKPNELTANTSESANLSIKKEHPKEDFDRKPDSSPKAATTPVSQTVDYMTHCSLCSQEFASKYAYRIHRIQAHGMINEPFNEAELAEEAFRLHNGDLPKYVSTKIGEEIAALERNAEATGFSTMFGSMVAAKLADRVSCDICNKELCNKYFLKAHKLKVHGIDVNAQDKSPKPGTAMMDRSHAKHDFSPAAGSRLDFSNIARSFNLKPDHKESSGHSRPNSTTSLENQFNQPIEKPSNEELVKLGMDPEAYCEICKKEFCSKYFLRTHKQNIHGIPPKTESQESKSMSMAPHLALSTPLLPSSFMGSPMPTMSSSMMSAQMKPMNLSAGSGGYGFNNGGSQGKSKSGPQSQSAKFKERVTCELCNKELCNKYFLRTHMINKHGILSQDLSPSPSQNMSPNTSDMETSSNSSVPTDLTLDKNVHSPKLNLENSRLFTNKSDEMNAVFSEALNLKVKNEADRGLNSYAPETCHLCDRRFKSAKWLRQHILKDHSGLTALSPTMEKAFNMGGRFAPLELRTCSVCSIVFPSEMSMQLHMIQEHNAQVTIKTDSQSPTLGSTQPGGQFSGTVKKFGLKPRFAFSVKQKLYSCSVCSHKSKWLSKMLSHERNVHGINHNKKKLCCKSCRKVFKKERVFRDHMMKIHGDYSLSGTTESKKYRCTACDCSFPTPIQCHQHIRRDHIRGRNFHVNNRMTDERHTCSECSFSTRYKKQLERHNLRCHSTPRRLKQSGFLELEEVNSGNNNITSLNLHAKALNGCGDFVMQTFKIKQCSDDGVFVSSVVEMPVLKKLKNSASVSFMVTPVDDL